MQFFATVHTWSSAEWSNWCRSSYRQTRWLVINEFGGYYGPTVKKTLRKCGWYLNAIDLRVAIWGFRRGWNWPLLYRKLLRQTDIRDSSWTSDAVLNKCDQWSSSFKFSDEDRMISLQGYTVIIYIGLQNLSMITELKFYPRYYCRSLVRRVRIVNCSNIT